MKREPACAPNIGMFSLPTWAMSMILSGELWVQLDKQRIPLTSSSFRSFCRKESPILYGSCLLLSASKTASVDLENRRIEITVFWGTSVSALSGPRVVMPAIFASGSSFRMTSSSFSINSRSHWGSNTMSRRSFAVLYSSIPAMNFKIRFKEAGLVISKERCSIVKKLHSNSMKNADRGEK